MNGIGLGWESIIYCNLWRLLNKTKFRLSTFIKKLGYSGASRYFSLIICIEPKIKNIANLARVLKSFRNLDF